MLTRLFQTNLLLIASLALLLGACGAAATPGTAGTPSGASAATPNVQPTPSPALGPTGTTPTEVQSSGASGGACSIFTMDAVSKATGFTVTQTNGTDAICYYQSSDQSHYLNVLLYSSQADMATILQIEPGSEHVSGLGDDAFWIESAGILFVRKGDHGLELLDPDSSFAAGGAASRDALVTLARAALPSI